MMLVPHIKINVRFIKEERLFLPRHCRNNRSTPHGFWIPCYDKYTWYCRPSGVKFSHLFRLLSRPVWFQLPRITSDNKAASIPSTLQTISPVDTLSKSYRQKPISTQVIKEYSDMYLSTTVDPRYFLVIFLESTHGKGSIVRSWGEIWSVVF